MNSEGEPLRVSRRCPICFQDQSKVGAECRFCTNPTHEPLKSPAFDPAIELFLSEQYFRMMF